MKYLYVAVLALALTSTFVRAQEAPTQMILQEQAPLIMENSRRTVAPAIAAVSDSGLPQAQDVLQAWQAKNLWQRSADGLFFRATKTEQNDYALYDFDSGEIVGTALSSDLEQIKPNSGIRALIGSALVRFQLQDPDPKRRRAALTSVQRNPGEDLLAPLRESLAAEPDPEILALKQRAERLLTMAYDADEDRRIAAVSQMAGDLGVDVRATLNPMLSTRQAVFAGPPPEALNIAETLVPGETIETSEAYDILVAADLAPPRVTAAQIRNALAQHIEGGTVGGVPVHRLDDPDMRLQAYAALAELGDVPPAPGPVQIAQTLAAHSFVEVYVEPSTRVTDAASEALDTIALTVGANQAVDLILDGLSLTSIYFLAAIGLAITFGVMGVINMAHGEFIMMGAYTGYVVQQIVPNHTASILLAIPLAFAVTFAAGVLMERLVIRWLYNRPLETLLATFGVSIALQQLAKNIFGTQARPLTSPEWLDGAWAINDVVAISYIRIAIFVLAGFFLCVYLFIMRRTRLGLETRAVTQNPRMAASMGINLNKVNMLTFGLGSGIAGVAGVAIGLFAKVTSELGSDYIVQSFMTVVVGGVGNIWGTLAGAAMIGFLQKGIEWFNPSNTLAAQTFMIVFIIMFIQFRPRGIIALKGRAAGD
ncbi:urea ABC transporter permease subunit UrtB [uncultured Sulfitobacter sp.]|uniref:urea ABC transporter permease subunit UrtB n=1 Tax=uncultured Sulfitobacter sp. TaxID=191468 RepID=UPI002624DB9F|nr:urea ABC transporter permease subunit UrtB [uncultured Sulfitobacter sp.]